MKEGIARSGKLNQTFLGAICGSQNCKSFLQLVVIFLEFTVWDVPQNTVLSGSPHVIPTLSRGVGPTRGKMGTLVLSPASCGTVLGSALSVLKALGVLKLASNSVHHSQLSLLCSSRQFSFTELGRSLIVGKGELMNALGTSIYFLISSVIYVFMNSFYLKHFSSFFFSLSLFLPSIHPYLHL